MSRPVAEFQYLAPDQMRTEQPQLQKEQQQHLAQPQYPQKQRRVMQYPQGVGGMLLQNTGGGSCKVNTSMRGVSSGRGFTLSGKPRHFPRMNTNLTHQGERFSGPKPTRYHPQEKMTPMMCMAPPYPVSRNYSNAISDSSPYQQQQLQQQQRIGLPTNRNAPRPSAGATYVNRFSGKPLNRATVNRYSSVYRYRRRVVDKQVPNQRKLLNRDASGEWGNQSLGARRATFNKKLLKIPILEDYDMDVLYELTGLLKRSKCKPKVVKTPEKVVNINRIS